MSTICLWMLPIFGLITSSLAVLGSLFWMKGKIKHCETKIQASSLDVIQGDVDEKIEGMINKHLDEVVTSFKAQIPIAGMFLGKSKEEKLKEQARIELFKMVPEMKSMMQNKPQVIEEDKKQDSCKTGSCKSWLCSALSIAALIGLIVGLIEMGLFMFIC